MIARAMRLPYALRRASTELNVLASLRLRKVISTLAYECVTYQVTLYFIRVQKTSEIQLKSSNHWRFGPPH